MSRVWTFQDDKQVKKYGEARASWYVGWFDPAGKKRCKSCGPGAEGKKAAFKLRKKREAELISGTYQSNTKKTWTEFREEYERTVLAAAGARTKADTLHALAQFERLIKPKYMRTISSRTIAEFVAKRQQERGLKKESRVSPATINKELRHLRAVIRKAAKWDFLTKAPEFDFLREPEKLPTYVTPEHFLKLYDACDSMDKPVGLAFPASDWWRGLLMFASMTGWRISSILAMRWEDVDLEAGKVVSRFEENKGRRDQSIPLHSIALEHLRKLASFHPRVFSWPHGRRQLFEAFNRLQNEAGVRPEGRKENYGFHDLRRAFATMNADRLTPDALQSLMQHRDYQTTQRYIAIARQLNPAVANLFVPMVNSRIEARSKN